jgi:broad specificity phosphatase PhoE
LTPLYLLRHGPTEASQSGAPLGRLDLAVTQEGQAQWPGVKQELLNLGIQRVLTSDLVRAKAHALDPSWFCRTSGNSPLGNGKASPGPNFRT